MRRFLCDPDVKRVAAGHPQPQRGAAAVTKRHVIVPDHIPGATLKECSFEDCADGFECLPLALCVGSEDAVVTGTCGEHGACAAKSSCQRSFRCIDKRLKRARAGQLEIEVSIPALPSVSSDEMPQAIDRSKSAPR